MGAFNEALGVQATSGDTRTMVELLIEDLNARGGIAGREVVPVFHAEDANSSHSDSQKDQAACATWTQDNQVFAALVAAVRTPTLFQCLTDAGAAIVATGPMTVLDDEDYARYGGMVSTTAASLHDTARLMADGLFEAEYYEPEALTGEATIGLVRFDYPSHRRVTEEVLKPRLAALGLQIDREVEIRAPESNNDIGESAAQIQNAVLQFASAGVDHVLLMDLGAGLLIFFTRFAENQRYRPQYGLTSLSAPQVAWSTGAVSREQVETAVGVGWFPMGDVAPQFRPANPASDRCFALMEQGGVELADDNARGLALINCDRIWLTEMAANAVRGPLTLSSFLDGVASLGDSYLPPGAFGTEFGPGRRDGARRWAPVVFDGACPCFGYSGQPRG